MPKISIITPVYIDIPAKVDWLDEMIQSVLSQTIADWELILIDDKSPLSLGSVRAKYNDDQRLRWLENAQNEGPAKTRNTAVGLAESDCILPLDSDDLLASPEVLEYMYDAWLMDKTKIIYGNLQMYTESAKNIFRRHKVYELGSYTFELAMNLEGIMPITAMHSVECHQNAGGWKDELKLGLEDVEYWIAAGRRGFCGQKIDYTTLVYRRQETSRAYRMKHIDQTYRTMQRKIKEMHSDIYRGEFPMLCCGKGEAGAPQNNPDPAIMSQQNQAVNKISELPGYDEDDLEWVAYQGPKQGRFDILARGSAGLPRSYTVLGTGHHFQIHKQHHKLFSDRQHLHFRINQPDPRQQNEPAPEPVAQVSPNEPQVLEVPKPELSTLVRLDRIGNKTREADIVGPAIAIDEAIIEPNAAQSYSSVIAAQISAEYSENKTQTSLHVSNLGLSESLTNALIQANYTIEKLAETTPEKLAKLPGIGLKRGQTIIKKASEYTGRVQLKKLIK